MLLFSQRGVYIRCVTARKADASNKSMMTTTGNGCQSCLRAVCMQLLAGNHIVVPVLSQKYPTCLDLPIQQSIEMPLQELVAGTSQTRAERIRPTAHFAGPAIGVSRSDRLLLALRHFCEDLANVLVPQPRRVRSPPRARPCVCRHQRVLGPHLVQSSACLAATSC